MMTKRLQIITLDILLFDEEVISGDKDQKTQKRSCWVRSWFQRKGKKAATTVFLWSFKPFNIVIHVFSFHDYNLSSNKSKLSSI